jgi:TolB-like protein
MATEEHREPLSSEIKRLEGEVGPHAHHPLIRLPIFEQLKQRNVFRVAVLYFVVCWLILDPLHVVFHMLDVPVWANRLVLMLMAVGFPAVVIFAWVYEITPEGLRPTADVPHRDSIRRLTGRKLDRAIIAVLAVALVYFVVDKFWISKHLERSAPVTDAAPATGQGTSSASTLSPPPHSIAVLPFSDLSAEGNQGYFADGISEEILNVLAHVNGLKVASRTSSFQFRKSALGATEIAQKLGVRHILEGSVRKAGDTVRISAQLIDASTDQHEWSQSFDRPLSTANLFAIQDEIANSIVEHLAATVGDGTDIAKPVVRKADTADVNAYDLYLKGRGLYIARSKQNLLAAIAPLRAAVAKDPKFARGWELLGAVLCLANYWSFGDAAVYQEGVAATDTALRLDPNLSLAHVVRGGIQTDMIPARGAGGWDDSFDSFARAIERDETDATAYMYRGSNYAALGYLDRAVSDYRRCQEIDSAYELCRRHAATAYYYLGRTDDALRLIEIGLENGYLWEGDVNVAPAVAARGDRLNTVTILARAYQDDPQLIHPLFRALIDPTFNDRDRQDAVALVNKARNTLNFVPSALLILKAYEGISSASMDPPIWWARGDAWVKSPSRKRLMQFWHLPEYWRKQGFPPQCRPIGASDFECR